MFYLESYHMTIRQHTTKVTLNLLFYFDSETVNKHKLLLKYKPFNIIWHNGSFQTEQLSLSIIVNSVNGVIISLIIKCMKRSINYSNNGQHIYLKETQYF